MSTVWSVRRAALASADTERSPQKVRAASACPDRPGPAFPPCERVGGRAPHPFRGLPHALGDVGQRRRPPQAEAALVHVLPRLSGVAPRERCPGVQRPPRHRRVPGMLAYQRPDPRQAEDPLTRRLPLTRTRVAGRPRDPASTASALACVALSPSSTRPSPSTDTCGRSGAPSARVPATAAHPGP